MPRYFTVYLVNDAGVRASTATLRFTEGVTLAQAKRLATKNYRRFVILDEAGVQHYASDKRDSTGAYLPHGVA